MGRKEENLEVKEEEKEMKEEWVGDKKKWQEGTKPVEKGGGTNNTKYASASLNTEKIFFRTTPTQKTKQFHLRLT